MDPAVVTLILGLLGSPLIVKSVQWVSKRPRRARTLADRIEVLEIRQRHTEDYIEALRAHISDGRPPPPPPWPETLTRRA